MNVERPTWLSESIDRAAEAIGGDAAASTFLSLAFHVVARAQGAVHLAVSPEKATAEQASRFARLLEEEARQRGVVLRTIWNAVTHGPHSGQSQGPVVCAIDVLETPKELERLHINQTLAAAQKLSEESVLAIGSELRNMQALANSQVDGLKRVAAQFSDGSAADGANATVASTIEQLAGQMRNFGELILERTQRQARDIEQARTWTADIVRLGQAIATIAGDARILTFNARLESARIGEAGRGFNVIATSIQDLRLAGAKHQRIGGQPRAEPRARAPASGRGRDRNVEQHPRGRQSARDAAGRRARAAVGGALAVVRSDR
ncbi:MAG: methyl-accepting chemotaxis protein [Archangium sp.]